MPDPATQRAANAFVDEMIQLVKQVFDRIGQRWISVGTIQPDFGLLIHEDGSVFPPGQYAGPDIYAAPNGVVPTLQRVSPNDPAQDPGVNKTTTSTVVGTFGGHTHDLVHDHQLPVSMRPLAPGDRVLVAWLEGENDPVIIHRLVPIFSPDQQS